MAAALLAAAAAPAAALARAHGRLFPFVPICLALGIGSYFALPRELSAGEWALATLAGALLLALAWRRPETWRPLALAGVLALAGLALAAARSHHVAAPVLERHYYGAIEGRIVVIDRSISDAQRLTLDQVVLERRSAARTPARVRVSLHGRQGFITPEIGMRVILTGHLSPPGGPVEPGGFEFRRLAWFDRLGAVGYTRTPVLALAPPEPGGVRQAITRLRMTISAAVQARMPGEPGAFAAAILTGDRSGIGRETLEHLRASNLAHLLAISGLHMGLLTGFVFAALRYGLALIPPLALRLPTKKIAAVLALGAAAFYLMLSGGNVATERAFTMVAVMLVAVLADRRAISLRSVAIAATLILLLRPEALTQAGFQMSFAATTALVAVFGLMREAPGRHRAPRWAQAALGLVICSTVAGLATAPVAAAHFNRLAEYGLVANLLSVPLMGSLVMPAAVIAAFLVPLGLAWLPLKAMEAGTRWILGVAEWVAGLDGAVVPIAQPPGWVLPLLALGALWLMLWPGRARWAGPLAMAAALTGWATADRPALLIADTGTLAGVMTPQGRALSKASGERFVARNWLEADGDMATPADANARPGMDGTGGTLRFDLSGTPVVHLTGRGATGRVATACDTADLVILGALHDGPAPAGCQVIDSGYLARSGALAIRSATGGGGLHITSAEARAGRRPWTNPAPAR
ncbi:ComEC/Rec2 family competence protein [Alkalilacustris brevis]|uniref:ComEC/Rec2 family competence protein n=1 Tax=Alkalilacustris brevis TaxID=2026338 RepID=UPI001EE4AE2C|nr:ComEC/Rec2 family competence protein [Alkalilacustris brevis]